MTNIIENSSEEEEEDSSEENKLSETESFSLENLCHPGHEQTQFHATINKLEIFKTGIYEDNSEFIVPVRTDLQHPTKLTSGFERFNPKQRAERLLRTTQLSKQLFIQNPIEPKTRNIPSVFLKQISAPTLKQTTTNEQSVINELLKKRRKRRFDLITSATENNLRRK